MLFVQEVCYSASERDVTIHWVPGVKIIPDILLKDITDPVCSLYSWFYPMP